MMPPPEYFLWAAVSLFRETAFLFFDPEEIAFYFIASGVAERMFTPGPVKKSIKQGGKTWH
jgi:hypothetical protein